jgi:peptidoglycan/xylan/chitin deacetylase (PgdA/CDA1 family)
VLGWDEIVDLDREGTLRFEAHSLTHPNLLSLRDAEVWEEINGSKLTLEEHLEREVLAFSYPSGLFGVRERGSSPQRVPRRGSCERMYRAAQTVCAASASDRPARRSADFRAKLATADTPPFRGVYRRRRTMGAGGLRVASSRVGPGTRA